MQTTLTKKDTYTTSFIVNQKSKKSVRRPMEPQPPLALSSVPSGGCSALQLEECIEEVLKLTLISSIQGKLHTGLSNEYCANLLRDDSSDPLPTNDGEHYEYLSSQMQTFFESMELWDVIDGELQPPTETDENFAKLQKDFKKKDAMALRYIQQDVSRSIFPHQKSVVEAWETLKLEFQVSKGVISYPLYKRLALSLYRSIHSGALCTAYKEVIPVHEDQSSENKEKEWNKLIVGEGSALLRILKEVDFELDVQEPFFSQLRDGLKTIEGRCAVGKYKRFQSGHLLLFNKSLTAQVQDVRQYASFHEMLEAEGLLKVLPGVTSIEAGVQIYRRFYSEEEERSNGVLAVCVSIPTSQLYVITANILSGLSYSGVQKLLGFVQTVGTNPESLPLPSPTLLSTFSAPNNPDV